jgi:hypothetical protein
VGTGSEKIDYLSQAVSLHDMHYMLRPPAPDAREHLLRAGQARQPSQAAAVAGHPWSLTQIAKLLA